MRGQTYFVVWLASAIFFFLGVAYIFIYDHDENVEDDLEVEHSAEWHREFRSQGLSDDQISKISRTRDSTTGIGVWRFGRKSTCVAYGDFDVSAPRRESEGKNQCDRAEAYCSGNGRTMGTMKEQAAEVTKAILAGGLHPKCPLLY
jgi:hypothetical protein